VDGDEVAGVVEDFEGPGGVEFRREGGLERHEAEGAELGGVALPRGLAGEIPEREEPRAVTSS
jgi:hypothetical protein